MNKILLASGAVFAALAVMGGAFGAHALKDKLEPGSLQVFETAVKYQMYHSLALLLVGFFSDRLNPSLASYAGYLFIGGIVLFSGSLYLLSTKHLIGTESWKFLGPVTPLGGLCFIAGWILLTVAVFKK